MLEFRPTNADSFSILGIKTMDEMFSILVIDDETNFLNLVREQLSVVDGHDVYLAENGIEGVQFARLHHPRLVLLDWEMPGMSGLEVLRDIKGSARTEDVHVYMLTGRSKMAEVEVALKRGADGYITKPISMENLSQRVKQILAKIDGGE